MGVYCASEAVDMVNAFGGILATLVWPAVTIFILLRYRAAVSRFLRNISELKIKAPGVEATAKTGAVEAAAALGAAAARPMVDDMAGTDNAAPTVVDPQAASKAATAIERIIPDDETRRRWRDAHVLWVDDHPAGNRFETQALEALGVRVSFATSTDDAVSQVLWRRVDLVISDMRRPPDEKAGLTLLKRMAQLRNPVPVIIYTGRRAAIEAPEAIEHGAIACTNSPNELLDVIGRVLTASR